MANGDYTFTPVSGAAVTLTLCTETPDDVGASARLALYDYDGIDGQDAINRGALGRRLSVTGLLEASSEANLQTAIAALETAAKAASPGTLAIRGSARTLSDVVMISPPRMGAHIPVQPGGTVSQWVTLDFLQLVP